MTSSNDDVALRIEKGRDDIPKCLHVDCEVCIKHARGKYNRFTSDGGAYYEDGFGINCSYIPYDENFVNSRFQSQLTPEDFSQINAYRSALLWGEKYLIDPDNGQPWTAWSYQRGPLLCKSPRKVYRFGRRCVSASTKVLLADGKELSISSVREGDEVLSFDPISENFVSRRVLNFWENGLRETFKVILDTGESVICTSNHPFLTRNKEWLSIEDGLQTGRRVFVYDKGIRTSKITSIRPAGTQETFDIEVEDTHNFIGNNIVLHNTGKCLPLESEIQLSDGSIRKIGDLIGSEIEVNSLDLDTYRYVKAKATVHDNGIKSCIRIRTSYGNQIECTLNHPLLTCDNWKSVDTGLQVGDRIAVPINNPNVGTETFDKNQLNLLGYLLGDGSFRGANNSVNFTVSIKRDDLKEHFLSLLDGTYHINPKIRTGCYNIRLHVNNTIVQLIRSTDLIKKNSHTKFIPDFIFRLDKEHLIEFLWPLFTTDGWSDNRGNIGYCSASKNLALGVKRILSRLGIVSLIRTKIIGSGKYKGNRYYVTEINNNSEVVKFLDIVGLRFKGYKEDSVTSRNSYNSQLRNMPVKFADRFAKKLRYRFNTMQQRNSHGYVRENRQVGKEVLRAWTNELPIEFKKEKVILDSDLYWDRIVSIEQIGEIPTAGLEVPGHQNYVNDVVEHNTSILAVEILWYIFTAGGGFVKDPLTNKIRTNLKVLILAPQKSHIENIFDRIRAFLASSPALGPCIDRNKRGSPQKITLVTESGIGEGNAVTGFASGDSSGSKGLSARGQDADLIILDEGAFISSAAIEGVVLAILMTRPDTKFIISSTPSGIANDYFEGICTKRPDFAEFYVPSTRHPRWEQMKEQMLREYGSSKEQYDKEVLAAFSPAGIGVYREDLVRLAQSDYEYGQLQHNRSCIYTIGVDWNKEHGTEIIVIGTQRTEPHVSYIVCSENIPKKDHTSPRGISRIVELNQIWQPAWIYVDAGGGDGGQMLRYHGRSMVGRNLIEARLKDIVKDFDFGSKIEITEHDGTRNKVPSKPFMVENSVKKFELGEIKFPRSDLNIMRQLNNYIVARRTPSGTPIYASNEPKWGDHTLDALNLALVAIRLEFPSFHHAGISPLAVPIAFIPNNEQEPRQRVILPAAAGIGSRIKGRVPRPSAEQPTMVKYWGVEPSEDTVAKNYRRQGISRRRLRYGR